MTFVHAQGQLLVADCENNRIQAFNPDGSYAFDITCPHKSIQPFCYFGLFFCPFYLHSCLSSLAFSPYFLSCPIFLSLSPSLWLSLSPFPSLSLCYSSFSPCSHTHTHHIHITHKHFRKNLGSYWHYCWQQWWQKWWHNLRHRLQAWLYRCLQ